MFWNWRRRFRHVPPSYKRQRKLRGLLIILVALLMSAVTNATSATSENTAPPVLVPATPTLPIAPPPPSEMQSTAPAVAVPLPPATATAPQLKPDERSGKRLPVGAVTKQQADKYYTECTGSVLSMQSLNPFQRDYLCSCVSTGLREVMSIDDMKDMERPGTANGQKALSRFLKDVYFPCAAEPLRETLWSDCSTRTRSSPDFAREATPRCQCYLTRMMGYVQNVGIAETEFRLAKGKRFSEPYDVLISAPDFSAERTKSYMACFNGLIP